MTRPQVILLDDNKDFAGALCRGLRPAFQIRTVENVADAKEAIDETSELVLADVVLDEENPKNRGGFQFLEWMIKSRPDVPVIVLTGHGEDELEVEALRLGAADYIEKDGLSIKLLRAKINALLNRRRERLQNREMRSRLAEYEPHTLIGESLPIQALRELIEQLAVSEATVFITGESGVGKEVVARALHQASTRSHRDFITVNCAALSAGLLESELFGHEKGAFTSAHDRRIGMFEKAKDGTLLLDEVTEIETELQAKLLRALQEKHVQRVGSSDLIPVDVRIIATTNRSPEAAVSEGRLRQDLFYRLNVLRVEVPPLREHLDDVPLLTEHFLANQRRRVASLVQRLAPATLDRLKAYDWPGNVRELENIIERACTLCREKTIPPELVAPWLESPNSTITATFPGNDLNIERRTALAQLTAIATALEQTQGMKQEAQKHLGFTDRSTMRRRIYQLRNNFPEFWERFPIIRKYYDK
jgi:DNA-binding NtrC family response regulator